jgi:phosphoglucomutase
MGLFPAQHVVRTIPDAARPVRRGASGRLARSRRVMMDAVRADRLVSDLRSRGALSDVALANLQTWLVDPEFKQFVPEIVRLIESEDWAELQDAFYQRLKVGTGGIRGKIGAGPRRINMWTIGAAARGLCRFIIEGESYGEPYMKRGIVVGHEARKLSREFAEQCSEIFAAHGIKSYIFDDLRATPEISFAVRHLGAAAGVQITASHNPKTDNGFKFYWEHGGQILPPEDSVYMNYVNEVERIGERMPMQAAIEKGLVEVIGPTVDEAYFDAVLGLSLAPKSRSAVVAFSPIHGAGSRNVLPVLRKAGFSVHVVERQWGQNPEFPTAVGDLINPEFVEVMAPPMELAEEVSADIAICSDPDADRIGVASKVAPDTDEVRYLTGNQVGITLTDFMLGRLKEAGRLSPNSLILETYVTSTLIADIARSYGISVESDLFVGYKFIAQVIDSMEKAGRSSDFVFSAEESLGYLAGDFIRDKDAAIAALLVAEMVSWLKERDMTLASYLDDIYSRFGYYINVQYLIEMPGETGNMIMTDIMRFFGGVPTSDLGDPPVVDRRDFYNQASNGKTVDRRASSSYSAGAYDDMIALILSADGRSRVTVRPSGTEPKLKFYVQHYVPTNGDVDAARRDGDRFVHRVVEAVAHRWTPQAVRPELRDVWKSAVAEKSRTVPNWDAACSLYR